ncbi:hypothetical protein BX600DRAFT_221992 [Xylariales sp. PMI_506]|nr:hypothetical protein BX600DRAFT_221992 [Xylariales sp. PMI_506]
MTSATTPSKPSHHHHHPSSPPQNLPAPSMSSNPASPPSKRDLKSWWKRFQVQSKHQETQGKARGRFFGTFNFILLGSMGPALLRLAWRYFAGSPQSISSLFPHLRPIEYSGGSLAAIIC